MHSLVSVLYLSIKCWFVCFVCLETILTPCCLSVSLGWTGRVASLVARREEHAGQLDWGLQWVCVPFHTSGKQNLCSLRHFAMQREYQFNLTKKKIAEWCRTVFIFHNASLPHLSFAGCLATT